MPIFHNSPSSVNIITQPAQVQIQRRSRFKPPKRCLPGLLPPYFSYVGVRFPCTQKLNHHVRVPLAAMLKNGKNLCTATCPLVAVAEVWGDMNPCEKILAGMNPVIRAYHTDRWLPEEAPRLPEEDLYRFLIPALIALLVASLVIAFFVLSGWKRGDVQRIPTWHHLRRNEPRCRVLPADNEGGKVCSHGAREKERCFLVWESIIP